jgi:hypothetical protein
MGNSKKGKAAMSTAIGVGIYLRVSTSAQSTENQRHELLQVAKVRHCDVIAGGKYTDDGIGGSKGRTDRPALDSLLKAAPFVENSISSRSGVLIDLAEAFST